MPGSSFGSEFRITTFGESHGGAVGAVVEGITPGLEISEEEIQHELNRRKPGQSEITTPRKESDEIHILSGWFEGKATGTPMLLILYNHDQQPAAYDAIRNAFRPGHADYTYLKKYGLRDHRGSGRASGRETAARVAAGAVAKKMLKAHRIGITAFTLRAAGISCTTFDPEVIEQNPMRACDLAAGKAMAEQVIRLAEEKDSTGGIVGCRITGVPEGLGEPVFDKLDADLAKAMLSLGAVKGFEIGSGFACAEMRGSEHNDSMNRNGCLTNNAGGVLGGISNGNTLDFRIAVKPTSSIEVPQETLTVKGEETTIITEGRHDPCICPRIVPVVEAMAALVLIDHLKRQEALKAD